jgi:hypothetical protein
MIERTFYCTCGDCVKLSAFMKQLYVPQKTFLLSDEGYYHFCMQALRACQWAHFEEVIEVKNPRRLYMKVTKKGGAFREHRWEPRVNAFREFLALIGDEEVIVKVMGDMYTNLKEIMEGYSSFVH